MYEWAIFGRNVAEGVPTKGMDDIVIVDIFMREVGKTADRRFKSTQLADTRNVITGESQDMIENAKAMGLINVVILRKFKKPKEVIRGERIAM
jgi:hypothetical protein